MVVVVVVVVVAVVVFFRSNILPHNLLAAGRGGRRDGLGEDHAMSQLRPGGLPSGGPRRGGLHGVYAAARVERNWKGATQNFLNGPV